MSKSEDFEERLKKLCINKSENNQTDITEVI